MANQKINVKGTEIIVFQRKDDDYISLTDIARSKNPEDPRFVIQNWMKTRYTVDFLGIWERIYNPDFNRVEFDTVKNETGTNAFVLTPQKWIDKTNAIGIISKMGRYGGGTFAHKDIAFEFASWISPEFKLYLIPPEISQRQKDFIYANEADVLNVALFGITAKEWREHNPEKKGNIRDYANVTQLVCLTGLESLNAEFIRQGLLQGDRLKKLNQIAIIQMRSLAGNSSIKKLES